mmetsp:Transcript_5910/g.17483  ORF Transcript_5910/g.17483 Transcript_5910/m.17483 type:complete len:805 (-) Transcript_5910:336-2750(-)
MSPGSNGERPAPATAEAGEAPEHPQPITVLPHGPRLLGALVPSCGKAQPRQRLQPIKRKTLKQAGPAGCESVDYDLHETAQYLAHVTGQSAWRGRLKGGARWVCLCGAGIATGLIAAAIQFLLHHAVDLQLEVQRTLAEAEQNLMLRYLVWVSIRVSLAAVAGALVCFIEPLAAGSGIPEIKCFLNGVDVPGVLRLRTLACKAVGIVFSVAAGLPCGKEGPMIHSGAIVGWLVSRSDAGPIVGPYRDSREARDMVASGAAAGVAAAFGAPIGGVLFAVEEGASHMNPRILVRLFVTASLAALTVRFFVGPMDGSTSWGTLGTSVPVEFGRFQERVYRIWELPIFAIMGVFGGLCGALFNAANTRLSRWRMRHIGPRGVRRFLEVLLVTFTISTVNFFAPMIAGSSDMESYGAARLLFMESGNRGIKQLFHLGENYSPPMLLLFTVVHCLEACWTYGLGVPSGLFVPSLLAGASFGRLIGQLLQSTKYIETSTGVYALIGATAFLSGMARITISLAVILMETTGEAEWGLPIFLTVMAAKWTGDIFNRGLYDIHIGLKKVPLLETHPEKHMLRLTAADVMAKKVVTLEATLTVGDLVRVLGSCSHHGFPVVDPETGRFAGLAQRSTLHHVLALGKKYGALQDRASAGQPAALVPHEEMARRMHPRFPSLEQVRRVLLPDDYMRVLDIRPYTNSGCYSVPQHAVLARCYMLFRAMGLRHLPVVDPELQVTGIITRKDLIFVEDTEPTTGEPLLTFTDFSGIDLDGAANEDASNEDDDNAGRVLPSRGPSFSSPVAAGLASIRRTNL